MVDQMTPMPPQGTPIPGDPANPAAGSKQKRVLIIVIAAVVFLAIVAGAAYALTVFLDSSEDDESLNPIVTSQPESSDSEVAVEAPYVPSNPAPIDLNKSVFTFRNIFEPLAVAPEEDDVVTDANTDGTTTVVTSGTLYLRAIVVTTDGDIAADFLYGDTNYVLRVGERIPDSPWQVLSIGSDSVVMLYGDTQVTLIAGQTVTK